MGDREIEKKIEKNEPFWPYKNPQNIAIFTPFPLKNAKNQLDAKN